MRFRRWGTLFVAAVGLMASLSAAAETNLTVAAAASLEKVFVNELIPRFEAAHPGVKIEGVYDASGKLQTQIEQGLAADVFVSAATKQMDALSGQGLIDAQSVVELLENKLVAIAPANSDIDITRFEDIANAATVAIGDPESVPVGQYSREALTNLGVYDAVLAKASLGTNVTEVLGWVGEGSADVGLVYMTDAQNDARVKVLCEAPEGSLAKKVVYPAGVVAATANPDAARALMAFLTSDEAGEVFAGYGFTPIKAP